MNRIFILYPSTYSILEMPKPYLINIIYPYLINTRGLPAVVHIVMREKINYEYPDMMLLCVTMHDKHGPTVYAPIVSLF